MNNNTEITITTNQPKKGWLVVNYSEYGGPILYTPDTDENDMFNSFDEAVQFAAKKSAVTNKEKSKIYYILEATAFVGQPKEPVKVLVTPLV